MARILVFSDRLPSDTDWTGAVEWHIVQSLAEAHHEVLVLRGPPVDSLTVTHPRLVITRPAPSWSAVHWPKIAQVLATFRPDLIQTFALRPSARWSVLSLWPLLNATVAMWPKAKRFTTLFEPADWMGAPEALSWYRNSDRLLVLCEAHRARLAREFSRPIDVLPLEFPSMVFDDVPESMRPGHDLALVPAPISEWPDPELGLQWLTHFLSSHPHTQIRIVGGWGTCRSSVRRRGWESLGECAARVEMVPRLSLANFGRALAEAQSLWLEPLAAESFALLLSWQLGQSQGKRIFRSQDRPYALTPGSTANSISRLYTHS